LATFSEGDETASGALEIQLGLSPIQTFYTQWGDAAIIGFCFIFLAVFFFFKLGYQR
jgi:apolipoprotein N-acyltransferase